MTLLKKLPLYLLGGAFLLPFLTWSEGQAATLNFDVHNPSILVNGAVTVDINISALGGSFVGGFDLDVLYDDAVLLFDSYTLSENLGVVGTLDADDWSFGDMGGGVINLSELSWLDDFSFQTDSFTLATLNFLGSGAGISPLSLANVTISDDSGLEITSNLTTSSIEVTAVPVPGAFFLLGSGLFGLGFFRKKVS